MIPRGAKRLVRRLRRAPATTPRWVAVEPQPDSPEPLPDFKLFAVIGTWMEEDVVGATVANAFAQGCERVFLVDNESTDRTVAEATAAGAELAATFKTTTYDEHLRLDTMNRVVADVSRADGSAHIWWLWLDADEFPHAPRGRTVREHLQSLDRRFRIVGGRFVNHFPAEAPGYVAGFHPLEFQPLSEEHRVPFCSLGHRKHPLQRFDRDGAPIVCDLGFHRAASTERPLREPDDDIYVHHFPYRERDVTRRRLDLLLGADRVTKLDDVAASEPSAGMVQRIQSFEAIYAGDWARAAELRLPGEYDGVVPVPWSQYAPASDVEFPRWYGVDDLEAASQRHLTGGAEELIP